ncbi:MAG: lipocalin-like domain-containing protein [Pseudomonadota bacterium]
MRLLILTSMLVLSACGPESGTVTTTEPSLALLLEADDPAFAWADQPRSFQFPQDHGPHPAFRNEWWYFTGNVFDDDGRRFGYELTLFRFALKPPGTVNDGDESPWRANSVYVGHFAISDIATESFYTAERVSREQQHLAGAISDPLRVFIDDWVIEETGGGNTDTWTVRAVADRMAIDFTVRSLRAPILNGDNGRSQKSAQRRNASYYYSMPRWQTSGELTVDGESFRVSGESWLDREWSSSALGQQQVGWDWFALQLDDGSELMLYQIRHRDGSTDPYSSGTWRRGDDDVFHLDQEDFTIAVSDTWQNDAGDRYPAAWQLRIPAMQLTLDVAPAMADQELKTIVRYWEGAVDASGLVGDRTVQGVGYVELTGYSGDQANGLSRR